MCTRMAATTIHMWPSLATTILCAASWLTCSGFAYLLGKEQTPVYMCATALFAYVAYVQSLRLRNLQQAAALTEPPAEVVKGIACVSFPYSCAAGLHYALLNLIALPSFAKSIADAGGEDTLPSFVASADILISVLLESGADKVETNLEAVSNRIRELVATSPRISIQDAKYIVATLMFLPLDWMDTYGWRRMYEHERHSWCAFWLTVAESLKLDVPPPIKPGLDYFKAWRETYEATYIAKTADAATKNVAVSSLGGALVELYTRWLPLPVRWMGGSAILGLQNESLYTPLCYAPRPVMSFCLYAVLRARCFVGQLLTAPYSSPVLRTRASRRAPLYGLVKPQGYFETYPGGAPRAADGIVDVSAIGWVNNNKDE